jgi:hypothetical protein
MRLRHKTSEAITVPTIHGTDNYLYSLKKSRRGDLAVVLAATGYGGNPPALLGVMTARIIWRHARRWWL